jgi:hypothetical protein
MVGSPPRPGSRAWPGVRWFELEGSEGKGRPLAERRFKSEWPESCLSCY